MNRFVIVLSNAIINYNLYNLYKMIIVGYAKNLEVIS